MAKKKKTTKKDKTENITEESITDIFKFTGNVIIMLDMEEFGPMVYECIGHEAMFIDIIKLLLKHGIGDVNTQTPLETSVATGLVNQAKSR